MNKFAKEEELFEEDLDKVSSVPGITPEEREFAISYFKTHGEYPSYDEIIKFDEQLANEELTNSNNGRKR